MGPVIVSDQMKGRATSAKGFGNLPGQPERVRPIGDFHVQDLPALMAEHDKGIEPELR